MSEYLDNEDLSEIVVLKDLLETTVSKVLPDLKETRE
jgi:hypothetical protein